MDKRWIYIFIIAIIGLACAYLVIESSDNVGRANININKFTVTLPPEFNVDDQTSQYLIIIDRNSGKKIQIQDLGEGNSIDSNVSEKINKLESNENTTFIKNETIKIGNETLPFIYYERTPGIPNCVIFTEKYGHIFSVECYNYTDNQTMKNDAQKVIDTIKPDYKQKQD